MDIFIDSKRISLRNVGDEDEERVVSLARDFCIAEMMNGGIPHPYGYKDAQSWIQKHRDDHADSKAISWAIVEKGSGVFIGSIQLRRAGNDRVARLSYWIGKEYWGNGYASEAVRSVIDFAFKRMNLDRIDADHFERNPASGSILTKNGFVLSDSFSKKEKLQGKEEIFLCYKLDK